MSNLEDLQKEIDILTDQVRAWSDTAMGSSRRDRLNSHVSHLQTVVDEICNSDNPEATAKLYGITDERPTYPHPSAPEAEKEAYRQSMQAYDDLERYRQANGIQTLKTTAESVDQTDFNDYMELKKQ